MYRRDGQYLATPSIEVKSKKRLARIFDNPAHVWAHPREKDGSGYEQTEAWNKGKNFYFKTVEDDTRILYSYRDSYPIASRFVHKRKPVYLVRSGKPYSVTTSSHMSSGSSAVPLDAIKFSVPYVTRYDLSNPNTYGQQYPRGDRPDAATHKANLADIIERIEESIKESNSAKSLYRVESALSYARVLTTQAKQYAKLFGLKLPKLPAIPVLKQERRDKLTAFDASREARSKAIRDGREAKWEEQRRLNALSHEEKLALWRAGSSGQFFNMWNRDSFALLRVKGSNVETSLGVSVPINGLAGAGRLLRFLTACKNAGRPYQRNGHTEHIGNFTVESFQPVLDEEAFPKEPEWILIAGCHRIKWSEVLSISDSVRSADKTKPEPVA